MIYIGETMLERLWHWFDDRTGISKVLDTLLFHPVPPETTTGKSAWMYIFGTSTLIAFIIQVVTGIALMLKYIPSPASAYQSLQHITFDLWLGSMMRGMHYFGASAMIVLITLHTLRVFLTASYKFPREFNWLTGVVLLGLTLAMAFTGQLLRWDENGVWSVVVFSYFVARVPLIGEGLAEFALAGPTVGGATLTQFFTFHVLIAPLLIFGFVGIHLYFVIRNGISESPSFRPVVDPETYRESYEQRLEKEGRPYWPDAIWKEIAAGVAVLIVVILLAWIFGHKPLGTPPDPSLVSVNPQPDWFFRWYYALLTFKPEFLETFVMVYAPILLGIALILLPFVSNRGRRTLIHRPLAVGVSGFLVIALIVLTMHGIDPYWVPNFDTEPLPVALLPVADEQVIQGSQIFHARGCQYCHKVIGRGGDYGPDLTDVRKRLSPEIIAARTLNGVGEMPAYLHILTTEELDAIVAFLVALGPPAPDTPLDSGP
jgi:ubiquinol-cytochrome c reductase cytochrome b subunit